MLNNILRRVTRIASISDNEWIIYRNQFMIELELNLIIVRYI